MQVRSATAMNHGARVRGATMVLALGLLAGCMSTSLNGEPRSRASDPSGRWLLDPAASDDALKIISAATPVPRALPPPPVTSPPSGPNDEGGSRGQRGQRGPSGQGGSSNAARAFDDNAPRLRPSERLQFVRSAAVPAEELVIERSERMLTVVQGDRRRHFELAAEDPPTITDRYGSRRIRAGFDGDSLTIESVDGGRVRLDEVWRRGAEAGTLVSDVTLKAWDFKSIHVRSVYRRAGAGTALPHASDGPTPGAVR